MTTKWNKNLFGLTVTASKDLITCAHMEPYKNGPTYGADKTQKQSLPFYSKVGKCYKASIGSRSFQTLFEFDNTNEQEVRTSLSQYQECEAEGSYWNEVCSQWEYTFRGYTFPWKHDWDAVSIMGTNHVQTNKGVVFNVPYARWEGFNFNKYFTKKMAGSIVQYLPSRSSQNPFFLVAKGNWYKRFDTKSSYLPDPHNQDHTGTSLTKGNFFSFNRDLEHFVVGAPNADNLQGRAYICHDCFGIKSQYNARELVPRTRQLGERFGASVATVDINGDTFDDIVVGAPLHSQHDKADVGRIIVFKNVNPQQGHHYFNREIKEVSPRELKAHSRFGFSIANIGDIHKDGFEDFAVGAPKEDDAGAVFIFHGCQDFNFEHYQKLRAEDFNLPIQSGFGSSLSKEIADVDSNGFNDFAIGAPFHGSAIILRSRPVVSFKPSKVEFDALPDIDPGQKNFTLKLRIKTREWTHFIQDVYAKIDLSFDDRIELLDHQVPSNIRFRITKDIQFPDLPLTHIEKLNFQPKRPNFGIDPDDPKEPKPIRIEAQVKFEVNPCSSGQSKILCPILSPHVASNCIDCNPKTKIDLKTGCEKKDACQCDLKFSVEKHSGMKAIVVGQDKHVELELEVVNRGVEPGFGASIVFSSKVNFLSIQGPRGYCNNLNSTNGLFMKECTLRKLNANNVSNTIFNFKLPTNFEGATDFTIHSGLRSHCNGLSTEDTLDDSLKFELRYETDIKVTPFVPESQIA